MKVLYPVFWFRDRSALLWAAALILIGNCASGLSKPPSALVLSSIAEIRALSENEARQRLPVHLHPIVTYFNASSHDVFLHDETGGIWMEWKRPAQQPVVGQKLDLYAVTSFSFATDIANVRWTVLGTGPFPQPRRVTYEQMASTNEDSRWVEAQGTVRQAAFMSRTPDEKILWMDLAMAGGHIDVQIPWDGSPVPAGLVDRTVLLHGVCGAQYNAKNQLVGVEMYVPSLKQMTTLEAPDPDPFAGLAVPINSLQKFGSRKRTGRVKLAGTVTTLVRREGFYLRDETDSIFVHTRQNLTIHRGDRVEALGFLELEPPRILLDDAFFRRIDGGNVVQPIALTPAKAMSGLYDSEFVSLEGRVVGESNMQRQQKVMLQNERNMFAVVYEGLNSPSRLPAEGSIVRVTGICLNDTNDLAQVTGFRVQVQDEADLVTLRGAPWWTMQRTFTLLAVLGCATALVLIWVAILRRRVADQTSLISEKLAQEESLKYAAEQASRAKSDFLANMSHEIRTPLNAVLGFTDLLLETPLDEEQRDYVTTVQASSKALTHILNEILDYSKIEAGQMSLEHVPFSLGVCTRQVMQLVTPEAMRKNLETQIDIAEDVPLEVVGDPHRLHQVLLNLLSNALKFTESGFLRVEVARLSGGPEWVELRFSVIDSGIGIPPEAQKKIFDSFSQADESTTRKYGGTGLGLAICSRLVSLYSGKIWLDSEYGVGSRFHFTARFALPAAVPETVRLTPAGTATVSL